MAVIRPYNVAEVEARPLPAVSANIAGAGDVGLFGGNQAKDMQVAGAYMEKASDSLQKMQEREALQANETRVEEEVNSFISAKQNALYTKPDAFYRLRGEAAINGAQAVTDNLLDLKKEALSRAANPMQRDMLAKRLDGQIADATSGISRHVAAQSMEWQKQVAAGRSVLINTEIVNNANDDAKVDGLIAAAGDGALKEAKDAGHLAPDDPYTLALVQQKKGQAVTTAVTQRLADNDPRGALRLYEKYKGQIGFKEDDALAIRMKAVRRDIDSNDLIAKYAPGVSSEYRGKVFKAEGGTPENDFKENSIGALGRFGMIPGTYTSLAQGTDWGKGKSQAEIRSMLLSRDGGLDKQQQLQGILEQKQRQTLQDNGLGVNDTNMYALHHFGEGAGPRLLQQDASTPLRQGMLAAHGGDAAFVDKVYAANPYLSGIRTVGDLRGELARRIGANPDMAEAGVGFDKVAVKKIQDDILKDPTASTEVKYEAVAKIQKQSNLAESARTAELKGLDDVRDTTMLTAALAPTSVAKGTFATLAERYEQAGDRSKALEMRALAAMENDIYNFSGAPKETQDTIKALFSGKAKEILEGRMKAGVDKDAGKMASEEFAGIKTAVEAGVKPETLTGKAEKAIKLALAAGDQHKAQEIHDYFSGHVMAQKAGQQGPQAIDATLREWKSTIEAGKNDNNVLTAYKALQDIQRQQETAFKQDAFKAGIEKYGFQIQPMNWQGDIAGQLATRDGISRQISANEGRIEVLPFTQNEVTDLRNRLEQGGPAQQEAIMRALSVMPKSAIPGLASALSGQKEGTALSRSYAAALSLFAGDNPQDNATARLVLDGAQRRKAASELGKEQINTAAVRTAFEEKMGNAFVAMGTKAPAIITDAVESAYYSLAAKAGKLTFDPDLFNQAADAVIGKPITINGQMMIPPHGADEYQTRNAIAALTPEDIGTLKTLNGSDVTAEKIKRYGILQNAAPSDGGGDGRYYVLIQDPANGWNAGYVKRADGRPFILDLKPLVERVGVGRGVIAPGGAPATETLQWRTEQRKMIEGR